jgi:hypothetical protein
MSDGCTRSKLADHSICTSAVAGTSGYIVYSHKSNIMRKTTLPNKIKMEEAYTELRGWACDKYQHRDVVTLYTNFQKQGGELCQILREG